MRLYAEGLSEFTYYIYSHISYDIIKNKKKSPKVLKESILKKCLYFYDIDIYIIINSFVLKKKVFSGKVENKNVLFNREEATTFSIFFRLMVSSVSSVLTHC